MNNLIARKITVTDEFQALASEKTIATVTVSVLPNNSGEVLLLGDTADEVPLQPGEWHTLQSVNLADIQIKGTSGDVITIIGGTW